MLNFIFIAILYSSFCAGVISIVGYLYVKWAYSYWRRNNVPFEEPSFPYGNLQMKKKKEHLSQHFAEIYRKHKVNNDQPMAGAYFLLRPVLLAFDLDLVRRIFITDFQNFQHRGIYYNEKHDPLSAHMFNLDYDKWKPLRSKLSSSFSSGKMKFMFPTVSSIADRLVDSLSTAIHTDSELEMYEWLGRFTTDVIGTCAFGIECNSLKDPEAEFRQMGRKVFEEPKLRKFERIIIGASQRLAKVLGIYYNHDDVTDFFMNIVKNTISYRESNDIQRNDFMSILINLKNSPNVMEQLTINEIAAEAFIFFVAGFETSSTALTYCLYELSSDKNKHIQEAARREIATVLDKHNGELSYEALGEMTYIEQILNETLRMHPPAAHMARVATKSYKVPNSHLTIPEGMYVFIPVYAIHHDPHIYENPEEFDPNRFEPEQVKSRPSCSFIPFGDGPRNCSGIKFGMVQMKIGLVKLLQNFEFSLCPRTTYPVKYNKRKIVLSPDNGMWLKVDKFSKKNQPDPCEKINQSCLKDFALIEKHR